MAETECGSCGSQIPNAGCKTEFITTPESCPPAATPCTGCGQINDAKCTLYTGPNISEFGIITGQDLNVVIEKITTYILTL